MIETKPSVRARAERVDLPLNEDASAQAQLEQPRLHLLLVHPKHFRWHAWHRCDVARPNFHPNSRRGADRVGKNVGPSGGHRLHPVPLWHRPPAFREQLLNVPERFVVEHQIDAGDGGQHLAGQVVEGRAETAGGENNVRPLGRGTEQ